MSFGYDSKAVFNYNVDDIRGHARTLLNRLRDKREGDDVNVSSSFSWFELRIYFSKGDEGARDETDRVSLPQSRRHCGETGTRLFSFKETPPSILGSTPSDRTVFCSCEIECFSQSQLEHLNSC